MGERIEAEPLRVALLGPVRAWRCGAELALGAPRQRAVLARLAVVAGRLVSRDELVDALWGDAPPASVVNCLHTYVAGLRRVLEPGRGRRAPGQVMLAAPPGYLLRLPPEQVDVAVFARCLRQARESRSAGRLDAAVKSWENALALWSGTPLSGIPGPFAGIERARLDEEYWTAVEDRAEALLMSGRAADVATELAGRVRDQPLRERLRGLVMLALYRAGRQAEALAVFGDIRQHLVAELGVEPGPELQRLHQRILAADEALLLAESSPAASLLLTRVIPAQLPHDVGGFTGRAAGLARLMALARSAGGTGGTAGPRPVPIAVISGIAGVGKTALAVHAAHRIASFFPDGQLFIDLRGFTPGATPKCPGEALGHLLRGLGADPRYIPADTDGQAAMYRSMLAGRRVLIVLDNAGSAEQVRPLLPGAGTCLVLITSRNRLDGLIARDGGSRVALGVLTPDEAVALLAGIGDANGAAAGSGVLAELARLCGYLPLALRIAAERAATGASGSLADLAADLSIEHDRLDLLAVADDGTSVRSVFAASYHALPAATAEAFGLLGLHPGTDISSSSAGVLLDTTRRHARTMLNELARGHLIEQMAPDRYRFHDLIGVYSAELAAMQPHDQRAEATGRLIEWYLHTADAADAFVDPRRPRIPLSPPGHAVQPLRFSSYAEALRWCDAESGNIPAIARHAADSGHLTEAWQLPTALFGYFYLKKPWTTWIAATETGLTAARGARDLLGQAATQTSLGIAYGELRQSKTAIDHLSHALPLLRAIGHRPGEAIALLTLGAAHRDLKRYDQAIAYLSESRAIWSESGDRWGQAVALQYLGETRLGMGQYRQAVADLQPALRIRHDIGDQYGAAWTRHDLAAAHRHLGHLGTAVRHLQQALRTRRAIGDCWGEARTLSLLGQILADTGHRDRAQESLRSAYAIFTELGDPRADETRKLLL